MATALIMLEILCGDALEQLKTLADESVQCCVTSPPYWGLRDYGTAKWEGGDSACDHRRYNGYISGLEGGKEAQEIGKLFKDECGKCGARRIDSQLGLEKTPEEYVAKMVAVFREVRRVLRDDGTLWLNLGDSYASNTVGSGGTGKSTLTNRGQCKEAAQIFSPRKVRHGCKPKDLVGIPWMVAFALRADGWWLRQDIIWAKPNPMPESVTDRCTKAHEYVFLLTKSARYFYDAEAIWEPMAASSIQRVNQDNFDNQTGGPKDYGHRTNSNRSARKALCNLKEKLVASEKWGDRHAGWAERDKTIGANKRSVWTVNSAPYPEAHFATFPPELPKLCILAGTKFGDVVIDPFAGTGTTGQVAIELGRKAVLIELNPNYIPLIKARCNTTPGLPLCREGADSVPK